MINQHDKNMRWLGEGDPVKIKALEKMGWLEYFIMLDEKMAEAQKRQQQNLAQQGAARKGKR